MRAQLLASLGVDEGVRPTLSGLGQVVVFGAVFVG
jgi:hypothetical protein